MRHREPRDNRSALGHFEDDTTVLPPVAPAIDHVAGTDRRHITRTSVHQRESVQMAAILRHHLAHKGWPPQRRKTRAFGERRQTVKAGGDKDDATILINGEVVDIEVASRMADLRNVETIVSLMKLPGLQQILKSPQLVLSAQP